MEYFGDVTKHKGAALKTLGANELNATYTLGGSMCKHCAPIIYVQVCVTNHEQFTDKFLCCCRPLTKLEEGNIFTSVSNSVRGRGVPCDHYP